MTAYDSVFSTYYDSLISDFDYKKTARYLYDLAQLHNKEPGLVLDLACGTGSLAREFSLLGLDVIAVDGSESMLSEAYNKNIDLEKRILFLKQDMEDLDLFGTVDTAFCTLDSLNHLYSDDSLKKVLKKLYLFIEPNGLFIFDINTDYKHRVILDGNSFVKENDSVFCVWKNCLAPDYSLIIDLDIFVKENNNLYSRYHDRIREITWTREKMTSILNECGFDVLEVYGDYTYDMPSKYDQRNVYVVRRMGV